MPGHLTAYRIIYRVVRAVCLRRYKI